MLGVTALLVRLWGLLGIISALSAIGLAVTSRRGSCSWPSVNAAVNCGENRGNTWGWIVLGAFVLVVVFVVRHGERDAVRGKSDRLDCGPQPVAISRILTDRRSISQEFSSTDFGTDFILRVW